jgi:hypothetical protein
VMRCGFWFLLSSLAGWMDGWTDVLYAYSVRALLLPRTPGRPRTVRARCRSCAHGRHCRPALRVYSSRIASRGGSGRGGVNSGLLPSRTASRRSVPRSVQSSDRSVALGQAETAEDAISSPVPLPRRNAVEYIGICPSARPQEPRDAAPRPLPAGACGGSPAHESWGG